jgi:hypothetical protein
MHVHSKLILACEGIPDLRIACQKPSYTLQGLITDLRASATTYDRTNASSGQESLVTNSQEAHHEDDAYFTDRKYHNQDRYNRPYRPNYDRPNRPNYDRPNRPQFDRPQFDRSQNWRNTERSNRPEQSDKRTCYVCHKPDCRS